MRIEFPLRTRLFKTFKSICNPVEFTDILDRYFHQCSGITSSKTEDRREYCIGDGGK